MYIPNMDKVKEQIMDALRVRDQGENIFGLCGPNKRVDYFVETTIRRAERDRLFQNIVTTTVTEKPDITKIQTEIGDAIERARLLFAKMKELQTVLVVLYDLHGRLDLGEIGIPFGEDHNGCKILLTSTSLE
ncbi:CC-NBS-LRR resistance protein, partial [Trifolium pratense]